MEATRRTPRVRSFPAAPEPNAARARGFPTALESRCSRCGAGRKRGAHHPHPAPSRGGTRGERGKERKKGRGGTVSLLCPERILPRLPSRSGCNEGLRNGRAWGGTKGERSGSGERADRAWGGTWGGAARGEGPALPAPPRGTAEPTGSVLGIGRDAARGAGRAREGREEETEGAGPAVRLGRTGGAAPGAGRAPGH